MSAETNHVSSSSIRRLADAARRDLEDGLAFGHARRVDQLGDALLALAFAHRDPPIGDVSDDVAANGLALVGHEGGGVGRGCHLPHITSTPVQHRAGELNERPTSGIEMACAAYLVGDEDGQVEDLSEVLEGHHDGADALLALCELAATRELLAARLANEWQPVGVEEGRRAGETARMAHLTVESDDGVDDEDAEGALRVVGEYSGRVPHALVEVIAAERALVQDVLHHEVVVELEACRNRRKALWPEGALGVDVHGAPLAATDVAREEGGDAERESEL